jgi:hypothetical protein
VEKFAGLQQQDQEIATQLLRFCVILGITKDGMDEPGIYGPWRGLCSGYEGTAPSAPVVVFMFSAIWWTGGELINCVAL